ncbi:heme-binding protein [Oenococcus oeni]
MDKEQIKKVISDFLSSHSNEQLFERHKMERVIDMAVSKANQLGIGVTICIMDITTTVQMLYHMPNANLVSSTLAPKKAWSAIAMKESTKDISRDIQPGASLYQMETMLNGRLVSFSGGIPLEQDDQMIGAIGVSGGATEEDQAICETAVSKFLKE